jgi:integration host factor subunit beta
MNTFTRIDAIRIVSRKTGLSQSATEKTIETFLNEIQSALSEGTRVEFRGFGIWEIKFGKARVGRNPAKPHDGSIRIPARSVVRFKLGKGLKSAVQANHSSPLPVT